LQPITREFFSGEAIPQIAPAMAQAIFKITGKRFRSLPFGNRDLRWAQPFAGAPGSSILFDLVIRSGIPEFSVPRSPGCEWP
jgi:hypothetical protein